MSTKKENVANRPSPKSFSGSENLENSCKFFAAVKFRTQVFLLVDLENKTEKGISDIAHQMHGQTYSGRVLKCYPAILGRWANDGEGELMVRP